MDNLGFRMGLISGALLAALIALAFPISGYSVGITVFAALSAWVLMIMLGVNLDALFK